MIRSDLTQVKFLRVEYDKAMEPIDKRNDEHFLTDYEGDNRSSDVSVTNMVPSSGHNSRKEHRLQYFSGEKDRAPFAEWWQRFEVLARANEWSVEEQARKLPGLTTKRAFQVLSKLLTDNMTAIDKLNLYRSTLQKTFGLTPEKAFHTLTQRKFDTSKDDVDGFASDLVHLVSTAFPEWDSNKKDSLALRFFWEGLPPTLNTKQLHALFKRDAEASTLASALDICRDAFEIEAQVHAVADQAPYRRYKGKGKGKGYNVQRTIHRPAKKFQNRYFLRCSQCGGRGHKVDVCPTSVQVCSPLIIEKCNFTGLKYLIDTGATVSVLNMDRLPTISGNSTRVVNTITGTKVLNVIPYLTLMGVTLENCLGQRGPLLHVEGIEIDGILGMDYIRAVGGIHVTFDENSRPLVEFHTPMHVLNAITQEATLVKRIDMKDFTLEQHLRLDPEHPEWKYKWTVQWK